jgi:hypothetical protein
MVFISKRVVVVDEGLSKLNIILGSFLIFLFDMFFATRGGLGT